MSRILAVIGATGVQGGSIIRSVLADPELSRQYLIRAITRDPESSKAGSLRKSGAEVVRADVFDQEFLGRALRGAHTVFVVTNPEFGPDPVQQEFNSAKNVADLCVAVGVQHIIFSTLPCVSELSAGKYTRMAMFDAKAKAEAYIRQLPIKSTFFSPASYMENYLTTGPRRAPDGDGFVMAMPVDGKTRIPLIAAGEDTGKFIASVLADPEVYNGRTFCGADRLYSLEEMADIFGKVIGEKVIYKQLSVDEFKSAMPIGGEIVAELFCYCEEFGYYGGNTEELVAKTHGDAKEALTSLETFLAKHRPMLE